MPKTLAIALLTFYMVFTSGCEEKRLEAASVKTKYCSECNAHYPVSNTCEHLKFVVMWR